MNAKNLLLSVLIMFFSSLAFCQVDQPARVEIELDNNDDYFTVLSAKERGLILFREAKTEKGKTGKRWQLMKYDQDLNKDWEENLYFGHDHALTGYAYTDSYVYLLFNTSLYQSDELFMLKMNLLTKDTSHYHIKTVFPMELTQFEVLGNAALLGGFVNFRQTVVHYDMISKKVKVLPGFYNDDTDLIEIKVDENRGIFNVLMTERTKDKTFTLAIRTFDQEGEMLANTTLKPKEDMSLMQGRSTDYDGKTQIIAGTYSRKRSEYSRGIFISKIDEQGTQSNTYYNYADLKNFFTYMKAKRQVRVKNRIERKKIEGKKVKFNYRLNVHDLIQLKNGEYALIGEAYYPRYSNSGSNYGGFGDPFRRGRSYSSLYFDGYKYTHAVVLGFNESGKLIWDNSFEINDVQSFSLDNFVKVTTHDDQIVLLYIYENVIRSKIIKESEVIEGKAFSDIALNFQDDVVSNNDYEVGGLENWFDDCLYAYGVQRIKNLKDKEVKLNRKIFFINKIIYR